MFKISPKIQFEKCERSLDIESKRNWKSYFRFKRKFSQPLSHLFPCSLFVIFLTRDTLFIYWLSKSMTEHLEYTNQNRKWADILFFIRYFFTSFPFLSIKLRIFNLNLLFWVKTFEYSEVSFLLYVFRSNFQTSNKVYEYFIQLT